MLILDIVEAFPSPSSLIERLSSVDELLEHMAQCEQATSSDSLFRKNCDVHNKFTTSTRVSQSSDILLVPESANMAGLINEHKEAQQKFSFSLSSDTRSGSRRTSSSSS